jgi:hypothetical protein
MAKLADGIEAIIGKVPIKYLQKLIARKLISAGIGRADEIAPKLLEHYLAGHTEPFSFDHDEPGHEHIAISITDAELSELTQEIEAFFKDKLPTIIQDTSESAADSLLKKLKKNWPNQYAWESAEMSAFRSNLEARWGKALDSLRMLHTICRDIGTEWHRKNRRRKHSHLRNALLRLHVRSCQIAAEIIALLEAGYADGAMARWRTLHEVCIVALVLTDHNEQLAERYIGHRAVEAYRAMEEYERNYTALGFKPLTKREKMTCH